MADGTKKLSFGFKKTIKSQPKQEEEKKQLIDCLEGKSIKVIGGEAPEKQPLVIPLKPNDKTTTAASLLRIAKEVEAGIYDTEPKEPSNNIELIIQPIENETLEAKATRELLEESKKSNNPTVQSNDSLVVPVVKNLDIAGKKESTLDDYENIPIIDFGMAMLRGMGWAPGKGMGKHGVVDLKLPTLRPKGMGLGADKVIVESKNGSQKADGSKEEELKLTIGSFVKVITGKQIGTYGQVSGFDEDGGRLIMKTAIGGKNLNINEYMVAVVSKVEYQRSSKVLNSTKYEEYSKAEQKKNRIKTSPSSEVKLEKAIKQETTSRDDKNTERDSRKFNTNRHRSDSMSSQRDKGKKYEQDVKRHDQRRRSKSDSRSPQRDTAKKYVQDSKRHDQRRRSRSDSRSPAKSKYKLEDHKSKKYNRDRSKSASRSPPRKNKYESKRHNRDKSSDSESSSSERRSRDKKRKGKKKKRDRSRSRGHRKH